ncbi:MAG: polysaccharide biosynthesis protein, partial [Actinomycetota bacterium]|nr:polysaccharide biosynthesis protein [Actinomycetota bacterium]
AHRLIRLAGLVPGRDIEVRVAGMRPGEKLEEELAHGELLASPHPKIKVAAASFPGPVTLYESIEVLGDLVEQGEDGELREMLHALAWRDWDRDEFLDLRAMVEASQWT